MSSPESLSLESVDTRSFIFGVICPFIFTPALLNSLGVSSLTTVSLSEAQDEIAGPLPPEGADLTWGPWTSDHTGFPFSDFFTIRPGGGSTIPGFFTIPTPNPDTTTSDAIPGFGTISPPSSTTTRLATSSKAATDTNGSLKDPASTSGVDTLPSKSSMAPTTSTGGMNNVNASSDGGDASSNKTLVITLSTVLSVVAFLVLLGSIFVCYRVKRGRLPMFKRGISPIDDEEIESWKANPTEKYTTMPAHERHNSATSVRKPPSVIVYQNQAQARASEEYSPRSFYGHNRQRSVEVPQTPVLARAPNSRPGLTDETVEGDEAFIPSPRRQPSRLSKLPSPRHARTRSSRSSFSVGSYNAWPGSSISPRASNEYSHYYPRTSHSYDRKHTRIYSDSSNPPRLSFDDDFFMGGLSPRPLLRRSDFTPESEIGRAIG